MKRQLVLFASVTLFALPLSATADSHEGVNSKYAHRRDRGSHGLPSPFYRDQIGWTPWSDGGYRSYLDDIRYGIRSGRLTRSELDEIRRREYQIQRSRYAYSADGRITPSESRSLRNQIESLREHIEHNLRDGERRESRWRR